MFRKFISSTFLLIHSYIPHITENSKSAESGKIVELSHLIIWKLFQLLEKSCSKIFITREILRKIQNRIFVRQFSCWKIRKFLLEEGKWSLCEKCPYSEFSWFIFCWYTPYLSVFSPNAGKYGLKKFRIRTLLIRTFSQWVKPNV